MSILTVSATELIEDIWYSKKLWAIAISMTMAPLSWCYRLLMTLRHVAYQGGILESHRLPVPVIVVGNLTVGGSGKTPLVIYLAQYLKEQGYHPGIVSRGYKGKSKQSPRQVYKDSQPWLVGDESVLLARRTDCPVAIAQNRYAAAVLLLEHEKVDLIISDDGLQHHALMRDVEIAMVNGRRRYGNGRCLPAGPLRESFKRLQHVDMIVCNDGAEQDEFKMEYIPRRLHSLLDENETCVIRRFAQQPVHAVAGIDDPRKFFAYLHSHELHIIEHVFPDHYLFKPEDIFFDDNLPVIMTEKDAVKCIDFASNKHWFLALDAKMSDTFKQHLGTLLKECRYG